MFEIKSSGTGLDLAYRGVTLVKPKGSSLEGSTSGPEDAVGPSPHLHHPTPPLPALKPASQHHSHLAHNQLHHHSHHHREPTHLYQNIDYVEFDTPLTTQPSESLLTCLRPGGGHLPPPPTLTQQQPLHQHHVPLQQHPPIMESATSGANVSSSSSSTSYQDFFQSSPSFRNYFQEPQPHDLNSRYHQHPQQQLSNHMSYPEGEFFPASVAPLSSATGATAFQGQMATFTESFLAPHQHFEPSPAVLLHVRYVMESICEWMQFTDVTIITNKEQLPAHKAILASHSTFLRHLLIDSISDQGELEDPVIVMKDISSEHMKLMIQFFYNGVVSLSSQDDIEPLREACRMLGVSSLMARLDELSFSLQCLPQSDNPFRVRPDGDDNDASAPSQTEAPSATQGTMPMGESNTVEDNLAQMNGNKAQDTVINTNFDNSLAGTNSCAGTSKERMELDKTRDSGVAAKDRQASAGILQRKQFPCTECSSSFVTLDSLRAHQRAHAGKRPFCCHICGAEMSTKSHLKVHLRKHSGDKPFSCGTCEKAFADRSAFKRHEQIHVNGKKDYHCLACNKNYSDRSTYKRHLKEKHGGAGVKDHVCPICRKVFRRRETLVAHLGRVHDKDQQAIRALLNRSDGSSGVKQWSSVKCPVCDMMFYKRSSMEVHRRSHTGERPYSCDICGKTFARSNNLKLHKRIHSGEKPHRCNLDPECQRAFSDVSALKRHLRTHTGAKPYACSNCQRAFSQLGTVRSHEKKCKGNKTYKRQNDGEQMISALAPNRLEPSRVPENNSAGAHGDDNLSTMMDDNSLSVMAGSEPPVLNTDTLDSVRASCL